MFIIHPVFVICATRRFCFDSARFPVCPWHSPKEARIELLCWRRLSLTTDKLCRKLLLQTAGQVFQAVYCTPATHHLAASWLMVTVASRQKDCTSSASYIVWHIICATRSLCSLELCLFNSTRLRQSRSRALLSRRIEWKQFFMLSLILGFWGNLSLKVRRKPCQGFRSSLAGIGRTTSSLVH